MGIFTVVKYILSASVDASCVHRKLSAMCFSSSSAYLNVLDFILFSLAVFIATTNGN